MTTLASKPSAALTPTIRGIERAWPVAALWLTATVIGVFLALLLSDSTFVDGRYLPRGNDSFYHARRILDAAFGGSGLYQFDERIHAPDGSWVPWPWGYDYLMAKATQLASIVAPGLEPTQFLVTVPVAWLLVNAALFLAAARAAGLSVEMQLVAMLTFALSPLTQLLHAIGMIDHHYIEQTFVLLTIWLGLRWFAAPHESMRAVALAATLGVAPAFHNGLFILQLLPLSTVFVLWLRGQPPPAAALRSFGITLLVTTQLILLPSEAYRAGLFEFGLLSWFHFYVALCTTAALAFMAWRPMSRGHLLGLAVLSAALAGPLFGQLLGGAGFLAGKFSILDQVVEVRSPYRLFTETFGPSQTASYYSWLLLAAPFLLAWFAYRLIREEAPQRIFYAAAVVFGLGLMLAQFRFHYFGFFGFATSGLLLIDELRRRYSWHRGAVLAATLAGVVLAYQPALRERLFLVYAPGGDTEYAAALPIFDDLAALCAQEPGTVLANSDDGSPILYHTDCSVVANNFILRPDDKSHLDEIDRLMRLSPAEIREQRPDIKYLFVRAASFSVVQEGTGYLVEDIPIAKQLFLDPQPPEGFTLIRTILQAVPDRPNGMYARLYKIDAVRPRDTTLSQL